MIARQEISWGGFMFVMRKTLAFAGSFFLLGTMIVFFGVHTWLVNAACWRARSSKRKIMLAEEQLALLEKHQTFLSHRIGLMHKGGVDADILAETARAELGLYAPNDVIVSIDLSDLKF
jgi:cell division protein FtsB